MTRPKPPHLLQPRRAAKGHKAQRQRYVAISVAFDDAQFRAIAALAKRDGTSFAETVRTLCEWGLAEVQGE